ncbi:MAG: dihydroorotase [Bacteroidetes bacterium]|nr:dihydroorotase [Bacteroidota bacterium]
MKLLIKQALVVDPSSSFNNKKVDLLIENGILTKIGKIDLSDVDKTVTSPGLCISPGWVDSFSHFADPGFEHKETLDSGAAAAARGGFTDVLIVPNTNPVLHNKAGVEYILHKSQSLPTTIHPIGAITRQAEGKELAEMYDMYENGAVAFSDGQHCIQSGGLLIKALQYVKAINAVIIQVPDDYSINPSGLINEGITSTQLGLPGKPAIAEELMVARDLALCGYAESALHLTGISTANSLQLIQHAKKESVSVSCSVTPYHLYFSDEDLANYNTHLKVNPPLRSKADRDALRVAVKEGQVDCIASHHFPHETDSKLVEFEHAQYGMIGLETAFSVTNTAVQGLTPLRTVEIFSLNPRKIFGLEIPTIAVNQKCCFTLFDPTLEWTPTKDDFKSRSSNTPFIGKILLGKVIGTLHSNAISLFV